MPGSRELEVLLGRLVAPRAQDRDLAAAELGDLLHGGQLTKADFERAAKTLIRAAVAEKRRAAKESMFNALSSAAEDPRAATINWHRLVENLEALQADCLEHALVILGLSGDRSALPAIEPFLNHQDSDVRDAADDAVRMLREDVSKRKTKTATR